MPLSSPTACTLVRQNCIVMEGLVLVLLHWWLNRWWFGGAGFSGTLKFSPEAFFYGLLPPIVFAAGDASCRTINLSSIPPERRPNKAVVAVNLCSAV